MELIALERYYILIVAILSMIFAIAIWSRKDKQERWLMPLCILSGLHTAVFYIILIWFKQEFTPSFLNQWSTLLRVHTGTIHLLLVFFVASTGSKLWRH